MCTVDDCCHDCDSLHCNQIVWTLEIVSANVDCHQNVKFHEVSQSRLISMLGVKRFGSKFLIYCIHLCEGSGDVTAMGELSGIEENPLSTGAGRVRVGRGRWVWVVVLGNTDDTTILDNAKISRYPRY